MTRFENVSCSQCGQTFGPGDHGFSHCDQHQSVDVRARIALQGWLLDRGYTYNQVSTDDGLIVALWQEIDTPKDQG